MPRIVLDKVAFEPHPVTPERKRELNAAGYRIVDIAFAPPGVEPAQPAEPQAGDDETAALRAEYERLTGRKPDMRWGERRLRDEIAGASA